MARRGCSHLQFQEFLKETAIGQPNTEIAGPPSGGAPRDASPASTPPGVSSQNSPDGPDLQSPGRPALLGAVERNRKAARSRARLKSYREQLKLAAEAQRPVGRP